MAAPVPGASKRLPFLCRKTTLCTFHLKGRCTKGPSCNFAHSPEEVKAPPDLQRTKLCDAVVSGAGCSNPRCPFAHSRAELRAFPRGGKEAGEPRPGAAGRQGAAAAATKTPRDTVISLDSAIKQAFDSDTASTYFSESGEGDPFSRQVSDDVLSNAEGDTFSRLVSDGVWSNAGGDTFSRQVSDSVWSNADTFSRQVSDGVWSNADTFCRQVSDGAWSNAGGDTFSRQVSDGVASSAWDDSFSRQVSDGVTSCAESENLAAPSPARAAPAKTKLAHQLRKTRLCAFFTEGRCKRGQSCNFAHDQEELKPKPELARTKMCTSLLKGGVCKNARCSYAHSQEELQSEGGKEELQSEGDKQPANNDRVRSVFKFQSWGGPSTQPLIEAIPECIIDVKNTFLNVVAVEDGENRALALHRRSAHSAPPRLSHKDVQPPAPMNEVGGRPSGQKGGDTPDVPEVTRPSTPGHRKPAGRCDFVPSLTLPFLAPAAMAPPQAAPWHLGTQVEQAM